MTTVLALERHFGESGTSDEQFRMPRFISNMPDDKLCVSDFLNQRLVITTTHGKAVQTLCEPGTLPGQLNGPSGVFCEGKSYFVCEGGNHRVQKLDIADGAPVGRAGSHGRKPGNLWCPMDVVMARRGNIHEGGEGDKRSDLFVADYINGRVCVYDPSNMEFLRSFGQRGSGQGDLLYPVGLAVNDDDVFVSEVGNHRVSVFAKRSGDFKRCFGEKGTELGQLLEPKGMCFVKGWLLVVESKRVSIFSPAGEPQQVLALPNAGQLWGCCCKVSQGGEKTQAFVTDVRAGYARVHVLDACGAAFDDGMSAAELAAKKAAAKKAAEEEKMRLFKEEKMQATKGK